VYRRERWTTPDNDFVDVDYADSADSANSSPTKRPLLVLFHGLEGSSKSHYALAFERIARQRGWAYAVPHFRGCSGEMNSAPRAYHSGDFEEIGWMLSQFKAAQVKTGGGPIIAVGVSLGGNALMRWAQEAGALASQTVSAVASVSSPLDLGLSGASIGKGFNRLVYTRMFVNTMKPRARRLLQLHPGLFDGAALEKCRDLRDFDNLITGPLHGFKDADDYYLRASAKPHMQRIQLPALALNALNDPFVPADSLPKADEVGQNVTLWHPAHGGHAGFPAGSFPAHVLAMPEAVSGWLASHLPK
jgi:predicted alpha/beta-fold hydrolase